MTIPRLVINLYRFLVSRTLKTRKAINRASNVTNFPPRFVFSSERPHYSLALFIYLSNIFPSLLLFDKKFFSGKTKTLNDKQKSIRTSTCCTFCVYIENKVIQVNCRLNACSSYTFTIFAIKVKEFSNLRFVYLKHVSLVNEKDTHLFCVSHRQSNFIMELQVTCSVHLTCIITFADFTYLRGFLFQCIAKWLRL